MPFQEVPATVQLRFEGRMDNQVTINDLYFRKISGVVDFPSVASLVGAAIAWWNPSIIALLSEDWSSVRVQAIDLTAADGIVFELPYIQSGAVPSESAPNNVAACVSIRSGVRGRSARGRNYVAGVPNAQITLNTLSTDFIDNLLGGYQALIGPDALDTGWQWVIVSRFTGGLARPTGVTFLVTSATMVGNVVRSMRSREVGHGK